MIIQSPSIAITTNPQGATAEFDPTNAPGLFPEVKELAASGDPGAMFAALVAKSASEQRKVAHEQRAAAMAAEQKADNAEIADMHDKANLQRVQGAIDGAFTVGEGLCNFGAGMNEASAVGDTGSQLVDDKRRAADFHAGADAGAAVAKVTDGLIGGAITDDDAKAKMAASTASTFKQLADDAHDTAKDAGDLMNRAADFYKEYVDTKAQTAMAAIHRA